MTLNRVQLTERDIAILQFINEFGFCEIRHIEKQFKIKKRLCYALVKRLITANLIVHQKIYHNKHGVYSLTRGGAAYTDLPLLNTIPHSHYNHHLIVIDVYQKIKQHHSTDLIWVTERKLISEKFHDGVGKKGHIADGMLLLDNKKIAIEVELTLKGKSRIERILKDYAQEFDINEIWYYCQPRTLVTLQTLAEKMPFIKVISLPDFLHG